MMCTNMTTILSHQEDLGPSMLDVKYEGLGGTGLVTTPLNMAPNLSECNVSHGGIALDSVIFNSNISYLPESLNLLEASFLVHGGPFFRPKCLPLRGHVTVSTTVT